MAAKCYNCTEPIEWHPEWQRYTHEWLTRNQIRLFLLSFLALVTPSAMFVLVSSWLIWTGWRDLTRKK